MRVSKIQVLTILILFCLFWTGFNQETVATEDDIALTYWYSGYTSDVITEDNWIPFFSLIDVPYSLPLRGFISDSRNYFLDFGAMNWINDWIDYRYGWPIHEHEGGINQENLSGQLEFLFELTTARLEKPHSDVDEARNYTALDYVKDFTAPYEGFIPLIVMYDFNETFDDSNIHEWIIDSDLVESTLNEALPLVDWETELYWFDYGNATEFASLMAEKTIDGLILIDDDYLNRTDTIIHSIFSSDPRYSSSDLVFPTLIMLQDNLLWATQYSAAVGGLGRLHSVYPEIDAWCLNGRNLFSYFYGGDPDKPRISITPTVMHEIGHCIGQTDIHSVFGWLAASSCMSVMAAYQQSERFDRFDTDLINNAMGLQLWGRYLDEIEYFKGFSLSSAQQSEIHAIEISLSTVPELLITSNYNQLQILLYEADSFFEMLSANLSEPRKTTGWSEYAPELDIQIDWIVGPGVPNSDSLVETIKSDIASIRDIIPFVGLTLPSPIYNVTIDVYSTTESFENSVFQFWGRNLKKAYTSDFSAEDVPEDAFDTYPRNRIFQNQSGYAIDGQVIEDWLVQNPYTPEIQDKVHYRFYVMNLENITQLVLDYTPVVISGMALGGGAMVLCVVYVVNRKRKSIPPPQ
ncbi:MAG: hypothetical protein ACFFE6_12460 [Candidatus Thorarchaeota archaeon]